MKITFEISDKAFNTCYALMGEEIPTKEKQQEMFENKTVVVDKEVNSEFAQAEFVLAALTIQYLDPENK